MGNVSLQRHQPCVLCEFLGVLCGQCCLAGVPACCLAGVQVLFGRCTGKVRLLAVWQYRFTLFDLVQIQYLVIWHNHRHIIFFLLLKTGAKCSFFSSFSWKTNRKPTDFFPFLHNSCFRRLLHQSIAWPIRPKHCFWPKNLYFGATCLGARATWLGAIAKDLVAVP